jgi:flavodoxin
MKTKHIFLIAVSFSLLFQLQVQTVVAQKKILVAYFSHSGNTRAVAYEICKKTAGESYEIQTEKAYPTDYNTLVDLAKKEQKTDYRPELKNRVKDIRQYDIIFLGYPNWWGTYPQAIKVFLSMYDLSGKTIIPFCTHEGSELGESVRDLKRMCPRSVILQGLAIQGKRVHNSDDKIAEWLQKLKIIR